VPAYPSGVAQALSICLSISAIRVIRGLNFRFQDELALFSLARFAWRMQSRGLDLGDVACG
jgi:hypothetical protein